VPADTINKVCASSIRAVQIADQMIRSGDNSVIVAGGMESMTNAPYVLKKARFGYRLGDGTLIDLMTHDGLTSTFDQKHMVEQASFVSRELGISREGPGPLGAALARARGARDGQRPLRRRARPGREMTCGRGPAARHVLREASVPRSRSRPEGRRLRATRPGVNDGAGALVITSDEYAKSHRLEVLATIVAQAYVADEFAYLARTPAKAGRRRSTRRGRRSETSSASSLNEAFSSVVVHSAELLGADPERVNVNGGAVALGHPIGASGARILATMVHELRRNGGGLGLAAICSGGGGGDAVLDRGLELHRYGVVPARTPGYGNPVATRARLVLRR
jgi:acetyl-CoA C-acetyltransferase